MIHPRFVKPMIALLLLALVPTVLNVYMPPEPLQPDELAKEIPDKIDGFRGPRPGPRTAQWVKRQFGADDYVSREYEDPAGNAFELFAARSYDAKKLFHFPELALTYGSSETARRIVEVDGPEGKLPAHTLEFTSSEGARHSMYVLLYGNRGVKEPIGFMLGRIPELFVGNRKAMTLIYVQGSGAPKGKLEERLRQLLAGACKSR